jgi:uncharacterized membrane protein YoaK (UPF0700 family)
VDPAGDPVSGLSGLASRWPWPAGLGPLPLLLIVLTVVTGVVDAVSYVALGHVFVANMTGNVVFLAFALAGASGLSAPASLAALGAFLIGALAGGRIGSLSHRHRGRHLRNATTLALPFLLVAIITAAATGQPVSQGARYLIIVALAISMGIQNATARRLAVPDLTTTVLTLTLTGIGADSRLVGGPGAHGARRLISVGAMFAGALVGALLVIHVDLVVPLALATLLVAVTALVVARLSARDCAWSLPPAAAEQNAQAGTAAPGAMTLDAPEPPSGPGMLELKRFRDALLNLHRELLQAQRIEVERITGRMNSGEWLSAAIDDTRFAWLQDLTSLIAQVDEVIGSGGMPDPGGSAGELKGRARVLVAPPDPATEFGARYLRALQDDPDVVLAHRDVTALL